MTYEILKRNACHGVLGYHQKCTACSVLSSLSATAKQSISLVHKMLCEAETIALIRRVSANCRRSSDC